MKPQFIGLGAQKCATAWLYSVLNEHPQIFLAMPDDGDKDTKFFNYFYDRGFEWYENFFRHCNVDTIGEYSTSYFYDTNAPERVYNYSPDMKFIVSLRHPVERAFSNHKHEIKLGRISECNFIFESGLKNNPMYLYQSMYYTHLLRWLKFFPKKQILVLLLDDIKNNSAEVVMKIYEFLKVDPTYKPSMLTQRVHETRIPDNQFFEKIIKRISFLAKKIGLGITINYLKSKGIKKILDDVNTKDKTQTFPLMKEETRKYLLKYFNNENDKLSELIDRDLSMWNM